MDDVGYQAPIIEGRRRKSSKKKIIVIALLLLILIPVGIGGIRLLGGLTQSSVVTPTPIPTEVVFPTDTPVPTIQATLSALPTPTGTKKTTVDQKTGLNKATLHVSIENGSGIAGAANKAAALLKDAGYIISETKNADNFDYQDVTILVKPAAAAYLPLLKQDILTEYTLAATDTSLSASASADAVVIIGK